MSVMGRAGIEPATFGVLDETACNERRNHHGVAPSTATG
jgi:hypothetical protein